MPAEKTIQIRSPQTARCKCSLVYYRSIPRYLLAAGLNRLWPRHFFAGVAPLKLQQVDFTPPGPDWLVLRNRLCGICGSDLRLLKGVESLLLEPYASFPAVLGHEVVAEVVEAPPASEWRRGTGWRWSRSCPAKSGVCRPAASVPGDI